MPKISHRLDGFTESVIRRMTRIANEYGAVNLSQGFPDFDPPKALTERLKYAADHGPHQYAITWGAPNFLEALAAKQRRFMGIDIDPMCVRTAGENAAANGVADRFAVKIGDLSDKASGTYDLITANIVANAILHLAPAVPALLKKDGLFVASGIIDERAQEVADGLARAGLAVREIRRDRGWVCILAGHPEDAAQ